MRVEFLTLDEVLSLHADQIARYGGSALVRDVGLLESALAMPAATFGGELLHASLDEQAAAYLFHLVKNHPFVDGNKRLTGGASMAATRISVRVSTRQLKRAQKVLGARTTSETVQKALDMVTEKASHDRVIRRYSGVGRPDAFKED